MAFAGFLSYTGRLDFITLILVAFAGTTAGMTLTYFVGLKAGMPFIQRYGKWLLFSLPSWIKRKNGSRNTAVSLFPSDILFQAFVTLLYYFAGIVALPFRKFALYAYSGALFWVVLFLGIGRVFGPQWMGIFHLFELYALWIISGGVAIAALVILYRYRKR